MRYANQHTGTIVRYNALPKTWVDNITGQLILGFQSSTEEAYQEQGFYELVEPFYDIDTQYLGVVYWMSLDEVFTYVISDYTVEQLQEKELAKSEGQQDELIQRDLKLRSLITAQTYTDKEALNSQVLYPQWEYPVDYPIDFKAQDFVDATLKLFKVIQAHTSQVDWKPNDTSALWLEIAPDGVVPVWKQPTGAHDAYNIGAQVYYPTENDTIYTSTVDANVYAPNVVSGQWAAEEGEVDPVSTISEWVQPNSTNPYMSGNVVTYNGTTYESTADNNVWAPGVYGWIAI